MKLSTKYIMIILLSLFIFPISYLGVNFLYYSVIMQLGNFTSEEFYEQDEIEEEWNKQVTSLTGMANDDVIDHLKSIDLFPESMIFWLSDEGDLLMSDGQTEDLNEKWRVSETIAYMKAEQEDDYFTTFSYVEGAENSGYALLRIPQAYIGSEWEVLRDRYSFVWFIALGLIWFLFVFISWVFFNQLRKRLVRIQKNMEVSKNQLVPSEMNVEKDDEIGQLEHSFNRMVKQLKESREKEKTEEVIRKRLIANLSHDLRTPLSIINGHSHKLNQYELNPRANESLKIINEKVNFMAELIDNLSSYTVLSEGKLPINKQSLNITTVVRSSIIAWYPIFEELGFDIEVDLTLPIEWEVDETWLRRVLDNLFQNVQRHAREGKYIAVKTMREQGTSVLKICDHGPGMTTPSKLSGAGIGLSIVDMMLQQMNLKKTVSDKTLGTTITIQPIVKKTGSE
ncbi:HAMP domain-containing sensor histidine kinase [Salipaludibacillus agaradhaerens]|uniref:HAMP domain-containing sensor histidine kinase n=1 Tax=Salipaludibacillus agaradhaerens TaxID=76935 RepID=UPI00099801AF|nr:HAMP domain-containing sensor histidine kinase [Salipaludibacillus agaradhaerens]